MKNIFQSHSPAWSLFGFLFPFSMFLSFQLHVNEQRLNGEDEENYIRKISRDHDSRDFKIVTLNQYIEVMTTPDCEILFAEKTEDLLILVFRDPKNRLVANARFREYSRETIYFRPSHPDNDLDVKLNNPCVSMLELTAKRGPGETVKVNYFEGWVFTPTLNKRATIHLKLETAGDKKIQKDISFEWDHKPTAVDSQTK